MPKTKAKTRKAAVPAPVAPAAVPVEVAAPAAVSSVATVVPTTTNALPKGILHRLGLFGLAHVEPVVLAALASEAPLLLIGPHGCAKSLLLERLSEALRVERRHYNASLLNYDDLVGYPLPDAEGKLRFVETPASIWGAEAVFLDEISRCRPDMQNRVFPIIHERCVQGIRLEKLRYRWAAMNPPPPAHKPDAGLYLGSEPLDTALADRFAFVVEVPEWKDLSDEDRAEIVRAKSHPVDDATSAELRALVARIVAVSDEVELALADGLNDYVRTVIGLLLQARVKLSARRATTLYRNALAVVAASRVLNPLASVEDALHLTLSTSLPQAAEGITVKPHVILAAHRSAAALITEQTDSLRRRLIRELSPVRRAILAAKEPSLSAGEFSAFVADGLAEAAPGGRHALAVHLFETGTADNLSAAVAEQAAELYAQAAVAQDLRESVQNGSIRHLCWKRVVELLASLPAAERETDLLGNVLSALYSDDEFQDVEGPARAAESWHEVRRECSQVLL